jgi:hypothetical protein
MKARPLPPLEVLEKLLHYDPETGDLTWKQSRGRVRRGQVAGSLGNKGYWHVRVLGSLWLAHRLAWKIHTGAEPEAGLVIDHLNENRADNRWSNLRLTTQSINLGRRSVAPGLSGRNLHCYSPGRYTVRVGSGSSLWRRHGLTLEEATALAAEWRAMRYSA